MLILLACGSALGIALGIAASRLLSAIVYRASAQDPFVLACVATTMVLTRSRSVAGTVRRALREQLSRWVSVLGRPLGMIDDDDFDGSFRRNQFQS
jgi:hypothetical protein